MMPLPIGSRAALMLVCPGLLHTHVADWEHNLKTQLLRARGL